MDFWTVGKDLCCELFMTGSTTYCTDDLTASTTAANESYKSLESDVFCWLQSSLSVIKNFKNTVPWNTVNPDWSPMVMWPKSLQMIGLNWTGFSATNNTGQNCNKSVIDFHWYTPADSAKSSSYVQTFVSGPSVLQWNDDRILSMKLAQMWPYTFLYHSGLWPL